MEPGHPGTSEEDQTAAEAPAGEAKPMEFALVEEHQMLKDLVARFVREQLMPLEPVVLAREADRKSVV